MYQSNNTRDVAPRLNSRAAGPLGSEKVHFKMRIRGVVYKALCDTGSENTLIPLEVAEGFRILPNLFAANGSDIPVIGYVCIPARLGNKRLEITGLVTEHVREIMLGVDFLTDHKAMWDFTSKKIWIDGVSYPLYSRQSTKSWSRRVVLSGDVTVPPLSVMDVSANVIFDRSALKMPCRSDGSTNVWSVESHPVQNGVMVARSLLPDRAKDVPVQLMNLRDRPVKLRKDTVVGDLERLHAFSARNHLNGARTAPL